MPQIKPIQYVLSMSLISDKSYWSDILYKGYIPKLGISTQ